MIPFKEFKPSLDKGFRRYSYLYSGKSTKQPCECTVGEYNVHYRRVFRHLIFSLLMRLSTDTGLKGTVVNRKCLPLVELRLQSLEA